MPHIPTTPANSRPFVPLAWQLALASLLVSTLALGAVAYFSVTQTRSEFRNLLGEQQRAQVAAQVQAYLEAGGTLADFRAGGRSGGDSSGYGSSGYGSSRYRPAEPSGRLEDGPRASGFVLTDTDFRPLRSATEERGQRRLPAEWRPTFSAREEAVPVQVGGRTVAYVVPDGRPDIVTAQGRRFVSRVSQAVVWAAAGSALAAALMGWWLSRLLLRPLDWLRAAVADLGAGKAASSAPVRLVRDELGEVMRAYADMHADVLETRRRSRQLTADIAHDLGTPLTALRGGLEAMRDGTLAPTPERLARLESGAERIARLLADLRVLAQADAGELPLHTERVNVAELLQSCAAHFAAQAEAACVRLEVAAPPDMQVQADPHRLRQVLDNLVANALAHAFPAQPSSARIMLSAQADAGAAGVQLCVADNGVGVPAEVLPQLFQRLYRADASRTGTHSGLGLSIARSIVRAQGGRIWAEQGGGVGGGESGGLRVCLWLP